MYKILMTGLSENLAGLETFALNCYRHLDRNVFQIDFVKRTPKKVVFEDELIAAGSKVIYIPRKMADLQAYQSAMTRLFTETQYDVVWDNAMRLVNIDLLEYAKKYGVKERIIHSHIAEWNSEGERVRKMFHLLNRYRINSIATKFFACSQIAADFMFTGKGRREAVMIHNAVDLDKYAYDVDKRMQLREQYNLKESLVIGNVGRIVSEKNQLVLLKVLSGLLKNSIDSQVVLVGKTTEATGDYLDELTHYIEENKLTDNVIFAGSQQDMSAWYSVMDVFVMPSLFEGLPFAAVEAQANGLPCILSDTVSHQTDIVGDVQFVNLQADVSVWVDAIKQANERGRLPFEKVREIFRQKGYILEESIKDVEKLLWESLEK